VPLLGGGADLKRKVRKRRRESGSEGGPCQLSVSI